LNTLLKSGSFTPLFARLLEARGLTEAAAINKFIFADLPDLEDPFKMKGMSEAVARLTKAHQNKDIILLHGDYDVDGITSTAVLAKTLHHLKIEHFAFLPERSRDGYGVSENAIRKYRELGASILITADCGISAHEEIEIARKIGMDVIVIDHHRIPAQGLPPATIILNPLQPDCPYPFKDLSAGGLVFKLSQALLGDEAFQFLDLVSLSTVADVAPLRNENRIIVKHGLKKLSQSPNLGLKAIAKSSKIRSREFNAGHLGFMFGPRINACGRMSTPEIALRLLITQSEREAESLASVLEQENKARQKEERQIVKEAVQEVERTTNFNRDRVIVVGREGWHQGVVGIVASRLVDRFWRPSVVIGFDKNQGKGSGRSIKGFNLFKAFQSCREPLEEFGGHEQAVGLVIEKEKLQEFREKINAYAAQEYSAEIFVKKSTADLEISLEDLKAPFIRELKLLEPHGAGNPRPVFSTKNIWVRTKPIATSQQTVKFHVTDGAVTHEVIWTDRHEPNFLWIREGMPLDLAYHIKTRIYDGMESVFLEVREGRQAEV